jgi:hypothetical protein
MLFQKCNLAENTVMKLSRSIFILITLCVLPFLSEAAELAKEKNWLDNLDVYAKVFGAVLAALGTLFGLPLAILNFRKTKAEIRKLELESAALEGIVVGERFYPDGTSVHVENSPGVNIEIKTDPRFLGPLLLLLDFIIAWIILSLIGYLLSLVEVDFLRDMVHIIVGSILLIPILRTSLRVRKNLKNS